MRTIKTAFISDLHLGCKKAKADIIYDFLKSHEFENLYLVGDIIDIWRLQATKGLSKNQSQSHINIIQRILKLSKKGTNIYYIIGNHDKLISEFIGEDYKIFGNITILEHCSYTTKNNKKYLVIHGDQFDLMMRYPFLAKIGDRGYVFLIQLNKIINSIRKIFNLKYWSLSKYIKVKFKKASSFIFNFEKNLSRYAKEKKYDGIICGHIHHPSSKFIDGIHYMNCGCWTDESNCTFIEEDDSGELKIVHWGNRYI